MLETTDWHCKTVSITSFKQISQSTRWKSDDIFSICYVSGSKIGMSFLESCSF